MKNENVSKNVGGELRRRIKRKMKKENKDGDWRIKMKKENEKKM